MHDRGRGYKAIGWFVLSLSPLLDDEGWKAIIKLIATKSFRARKKLEGNSIVGVGIWAAD